MDILNILGEVKRLRAVGRHAEAANRLRMVVTELPDDPIRWVILIDSAARSGRAEEIGKLACSMAPHLIRPEITLHPLSRWLRNNGYWEAAGEVCRAILQEEPDARKTTHDMLVHVQFSEVDDAECFAQLTAWNRIAVLPILSEARKPDSNSDPFRPLRIGFISNDFSADHSLNTAMGAWFGDRESVEDTCVFYANWNTKHMPHRRFREAADLFLNVEAFSDSEFANQVRQDRIDILVDFIGHMDNSRLLAYAHRPAALTVHWIGVGLATGAASVDYLLSDTYRTPLENQSLYVERLALLPQSGICWTPPLHSPAVTAPPHLSGRPFAFGNFSRISKFRPETVALWSRVLNAIPTAIMILKDHRLTEFNTNRLASEFRSHGITRDRLRFLPGTDHFQHLAAYSEVDLMLDSFPEQSGVSGLEAAWMGVPMVAMRYAERAGTRVSDWIMGNLGLPALVASDTDTYVALACDLAGHSDALRRLRSILRPRLLKSAICDEDLFRHNVRRALRTMWRRHCAGLPPEGFELATSH